jgi:hypothetical protein
MDTSKSKLQITSGKQSKVKLGSSTSSKDASPLTPKKNYKKKGSEGVDFGTPGFGMTGLEGETK